MSKGYFQNSFPSQITMFPATVVYISFSYHGKSLGKVLTKEVYPVSICHTFHSTGDGLETMARQMKGNKEQVVSSNFAY